MSTKIKSVIKAPLIVGENQLLKDHVIIIQDGMIESIIPFAQWADDGQALVIECEEGSTLVPGRIDMHIHGARGADVMDATEEAFITIAKALAEEGTTGYLATTLTASAEDIERTMQAVEQFMQGQPNAGAQMLGVHLEGPFLSPQFAGAQDARFFIEPDVTLFKRWQVKSGNNIKLVTLAPELNHADKLISHCHQQGVIISIGHTAATFVQAQQAISLGCTHATHLYNAMSGIHHREPGAAAAILYSSNVTAELICDFHHLAPEMIAFTYQIKGAKKLVLVTDSMRAKCLGDGQYSLGHLMVNVKDNVARLSDGTLAGSILTMSDAVKNTLDSTGCDILDTVYMTAMNPAKALGLWDTRGSLSEGKRADIVCLNTQYDVQATWILGELIYSVSIK